MAVAFTWGRTRIDSVRLALVLGQRLTMELTSFVSDEVFRIAIIILGKRQYHDIVSWRTQIYVCIGLFFGGLSCWFSMCLWR